MFWIIVIVIIIFILASDSSSSSKTLHDPVFESAKYAELHMFNHKIDREDILKTELAGPVKTDNYYGYYIAHSEFLAKNPDIFQINYIVLIDNNDKIIPSSYYRYSIVTDNHDEDPCYWLHLYKK